MDCVWSLPSACLLPLHKDRQVGELGAAGSLKDVHMRLLLGYVQGLVLVQKSERGLDSSRYTGFTLLLGEEEGSVL